MCTSQCTTIGKRVVNSQKERVFSPAHAQKRSSRSLHRSVRQIMHIISTVCSVECACVKLQQMWCFGWESFELTAEPQPAVPLFGLPRFCKLRATHTPYIYLLLPTKRVPMQTLMDRCMYPSSLALSHEYLLTCTLFAAAISVPQPCRSLPTVTDFDYMLADITLSTPASHREGRNSGTYLL